MIGLGIAELVLLFLLLLATLLAVKRRAQWLSVLVTVVLVVMLSERLAPGTLAGMGDAIHRIDQVDYAGPHLTIEPVVRFER